VQVMAGRDHVATLSSGGRLLVFALDEMREMERGRGVILMGLDEGEKLLAVAVTTGDRVVVRGTNRLGRMLDVAIEGEDLQKHLLHRARKGALVGHRVTPVALAA